MSHSPSLLPPVLAAAPPSLAYHSTSQTQEVLPSRAFRGLIQAIAIVSIVIAIIEAVRTSMEWSQYNAFFQIDYGYLTQLLPSKPRPFNANDAWFCVDILLPIVLIIGCIGLLLRQGWARVLVIIWAYLSLTRLLWRAFAGVAQANSFAAGNSNNSRIYSAIMQEVGVSLVLPVMLLFIFHNQTIRSLFRRTRGGTAKY